MRFRHWGASVLMTLIGSTMAVGQSAASATDPMPSATTFVRQVQKLGNGVYAIRHADVGGASPQGNTLVVIGGNEVLVVDTTQTPADAREDIAQIKHWTDKPVRYVVNTHWHEDHTRGNRAYVDAFPGLQIIAHAETAKQMHDYYPAIAKEYVNHTEEVRQRVATGKNAAGKEYPADVKKQLVDYLAARESLQKDWLAEPMAFPTMTFTQDLTLDLGDCPVELKFLGLGNTKGDIVAFLPKDRIVSTGDLVDYPVPYLGGGYPSEQVHTLTNLLALGAQTYVPGHGAILDADKARAHIQLEADFIQAVVDEVTKQVADVKWGGTSADLVAKNVRAAMDFAGWMKRFGCKSENDIAFFDQFTITDLILTAYHDSWRK